MSGIVGLGGGAGASRLWPVLARAAGPSRLTLIAGTASDLRLHGLRICPDIDATLYALSGRLDGERGRGVRDESFRCLTALRDLGGDGWFSLGDQDLATHLYRTGQLSAGATLTEATAQLAAGLGVRSPVLPMSDHDVALRVTTTDGRVLAYAEYLVREQAAPAVRGVGFDGIGTATPAPGVLAAIESADLIVLGPADPVAGLVPILGLPGVTQALERRRDRVVAVSPVMSGEGEGERQQGRARAALLGAINLPDSASGVARLYRDICGRFIYDRADEGEGVRIKAQGPQPVAADLRLPRGGAPDSLLSALLGAHVIRP